MKNPHTGNRWGCYYEIPDNWLNPKVSVPFKTATHMFFTTQKQKKFSRLRRAPGFYWVRYSYGGARQWRVGEYIGESIGWMLPGDQRFFHDADLLEIDESEICRLPWGWWHWWFFGLLLFGVASFGFQLYKLITFIRK